MEETKNIEKLISELETLQEGNYTEKVCPTKFKEEDKKKYDASSKKMYGWGVLRFILFLINYGLPIFTAIKYWNTKTLFLSSIILFCASVLVYYVVLLYRKKLMLTSYRYEKQKYNKISKITYYVVLFACWFITLSQLAVFGVTYYITKTFLIGFIVFAVITICCIFLNRVVSRNFYKNIRERYQITDKYQREIDDKMAKLKETNLVQIENIKKELYDNGIVYCTESQLNNIKNSATSSRVEFTECPICKAKLETSYDYVAPFYGKQKIEVKGVYVANSYNNQVNQTIEYKDTTTEFPASVKTCPHCGYKTYMAHVSYYKWEEWTDKDSDGDYTPYSAYLENKKTLFNFEKGKLYSPNLNEWLKKQDVFTKFTKNVKNVQIEQNKKENNSKIKDVAKELENVSKLLEKAELEAKENEKVMQKNNNLITCIDCGKQFSKRATACPNCGCPTKDCLENKEN